MRKVIFTICCLFINYKVKAEIQNSKNDGNSDPTYYADDPKNPKVTVITAPAHFGKSTLLDMVKKFTSLKIDELGHFITPQNNKNKDLFCSHPFNICKNQTFMDKHFGLYPTIFIDYAPLRVVNDLDDFLNKTRMIVYKTFKEHEYLARNTSLFSDKEDRLLFLDYCSATNINKLKNNNLINAFRWLMEFLHKHLNKEVIVLVDNYDAFWYSLMFNFNSRSRFVYRFLCGTNMALFHNNPYLYKALLIGTIPLKEVAVNNENYRYDTQYYRFLGNHRFSQYLGFTEKEIDRLLDIESKSDVRKQWKDEIMKFYSGYYIQDRNTSLFNPWSVLWFLSQKTAENFWANTQTFHNETAFQHIKNISQPVYNMFFKTNVKANIDKEFEIEDFIALTRMSKDLEVDDDYEIELYFRIIFHLGYLSPMGSTIDHMTVLDYPNYEIHSEMTRVFVAAVLESISF